MTKRGHFETEMVRCDIIISKEFAASARKFCYFNWKWWSI